MRTFVFAALGVLATPARAEPPPLILLEARASGGLALGGGGGKAVARYAPVTVGLVGELTIHTDPWVTFYGGAYYEGLDRAGFGLLGGVRLRPRDLPLRFGAGLLGVIAPYTIGGVMATGGACFAVGKRKRARLCADAEADFFFLGGDLPSGRVAAQLLGVLGANFDVY